MAPKQAAAQVYSFSSIQIEGIERIEPQTVLSYLGITRGETVSAAALNDAYQRLVGSGLFETVELAPRGATLVVRLVEYPIINRISIEGNKRIRDKNLLPLLASKPRHVFNPSLAEQDVQTLLAAYQAQGRLEVMIEPRVIARPNNRVDLVFEVTESKNTEVERLSFVGNRAYSDSRLRRVVETKQAGLLRAVFKADTFVPERIEFDKQVLRDFYNSRGYIDFEVLSVTSELSRERDAFFITFTLREGPRFKFGDITTTTTIDGLDVAEFARLVKIRPGTTYNPAVLEKAIARMERLATRKGLDFVRVVPRVSRNEADQSLDIELVIERGDRVIVERIDIEGNATTLDRVIRSQFRTAEGDPFNPRELRAAAERIRALGFFADVQVQARDGSAPGNVVVDVNVEEAPTGSFAFGGTYSSGTGFGLSLSFSERNFLGRGQYLSFSLVTGEDTGTFSFSFAEPKLLGRDLRFGLDSYYTQSTASTRAPYDTQKLHFSTSLQFPASENGRFAIKAFVDGANIENVTAGSSALFFAEAARGQQVGAGLGFTYSWDNRRSGLEPDLQLRFSLSTDFGGYGSDYTYAKTILAAAAQTKVLNDQITLRALVDGGALISTNGADSRVTDRFFLGSNLLRGFASYGVGPRDPATGEAVGGNMFAAARLEAEFPIGLPEEYGITGGLFYDIGSLWGLDNTLAGSIDDSFYQRSVVGATMFWKTPLGPLRFNYSHAINPQPGDIVNNFEFTISTKF